MKIAGALPGVGRQLYSKWAGGASRAACADGLRHNEGGEALLAALALIGVMAVWQARRNMACREHSLRYEYFTLLERFRVD